MTVMPMIVEVRDRGLTGSDLDDAALAGQLTGRWSVPCHEGDPELWFADTPTGVEEAKSLCRSCPLQPECLAGAIDRSEPWGVWGGELFEQGAVIPRKRPRGRPRKSAIA
jgi:WhiB family redox-sensing transcriptional regulator